VTSPLTKRSPYQFVSEVKGFRVQALAQAPAAFRRRGIFVPARPLVASRLKMDRDQIIGALTALGRALDRRG